METRCPPRMYLDPPDFDIELEEFARLPLCRLEAFRLLREGHATRVSARSSEQKASTADSRALLLHGHSDRPSEAKHRRADLASHFILKLACSGGTSSSSSSSSSESSSESSGKNGDSGGIAGGGGGGSGGGGDVGAANNDKDRGEEEAERRRSRREWFVRAERDLFEARLDWHLRQAAEAPPQRQPGGGVTAARGAGKYGSVDDDAGVDGSGAAAANHDKPQMSAEVSRCEALRVVYDLGWLHPAEPAAEGRPGVERTTPGEQEGCKAGGCSSGSGGGGGGDGGAGGGRFVGGGGVGGGGGGAAGKRRRDGDDPFRETFPASRSSRPSSLALGPARNSSGMVVRYTACPFQKAIPLVRSRQVLLRDGKALLSPAQVPQVVVGHFEGLLRDGLAVAARGLPAVETDERVSGVLRQVRRAVDALVYGGGGGGGGERSAVVITRTNIDQVAAKHFPLCMRRALRVLRREHHLKYQARLQLVSFLGNAGMEVGELLALWREEFPKGMPADEYARKKNQYEYSLRHLYGLEGKRKAYSSQSCARIASLGGGGSGEGGYGHGCPFHSHPKVPGGGSGGCGSPARDTSVPGMLATQGLPAADIEDIIAPLETRAGGGGGALGACRRHFSATHRWAIAGGGVWRNGGQSMREASPNGWLASSSASSLPPHEEEGQNPGEEGKTGFLTQE